MAKKKLFGSNKKEHEASLHPALRELERLYVALTSLFGNLADTAIPRITIQTRGRRRMLGWFSQQRWFNPQAELDPERALIHEITICAEALDRPVTEIVAILLHEMVHLSNHRADVRDVGKDGRYHNHRFKEKAEAIGLVVEKDERLGWARTSLSPELEKRVFSLNANEEVFKVFRVQPSEREKQPTKNKKWSCGCTNVRCAVELNAMCRECGNVFANVDAGEQPYPAPKPVAPDLSEVRDSIVDAQSLAMDMAQLKTVTPGNIEDLDAIVDYLEQAKDLLGLPPEDEEAPQQFNVPTEAHEKVVAQFKALLQEQEAE